MVPRNIFLPSTVQWLMNGLLLAGGLKFEMSRMTGVNVVFYVRFVGIIDGAHAHKKELFQGVRLL